LNRDVPNGEGGGDCGKTFENMGLEEGIGILNLPKSCFVILILTQLQIKFGGTQVIGNLSARALKRLSAFITILLLENRFVSQIFCCF
jgi:hypothetical protein